MKRRGNILVSQFIIFVYDFLIFFEICMISTATARVPLMYSENFQAKNKWKNDYQKQERKEIGTGKTNEKHNWIYGHERYKS